VREHCRVIINDCLDAGSQIPWVKRAVNEGYSVLLLNPNSNSQVIGGKSVDVKVITNSYELF
jgi:hypothetical protein